MVQQLLEQLYNGEIYPNEQHKIHVNDFIGKQMEVSCLEDTQAFIDGFKLGAKLMLEIVMEDKT